MRFGVLGPLSVWDSDGNPVRVPESKVRALLSDLLVHEGRPVTADRLIDDLWGEEPPGNPANTLQVKVSQLRRALGRDRVVHESAGYRLRLDRSADEVDSQCFQSLVTQARSVGDARTRAGLLTEALGLWRGPAYADVEDEEFARAAAQRLTEQRLAVLEEQAEARLELGDHILLIGELADLVARYPLRERLRAIQLRALYLAGRQSEALASYAELRELLTADLGLDPSPELAALQGAILRQDASLAPPDTSASPSGPPPPACPQSNLPAPLSTLIGREQSLGEVGDLLGRARLVTLTGPGGVGKTRLAVAAATRFAQEVDEAWLVEFAPRHGGLTDLMQVVATVLGIRDDAPSGTPGWGGPSELIDRLTAALRERRILLVLDNCEHVVAAAAELARRLLCAAPDLRVLATSREPLGLTGEMVFLVEPLRPAAAVRLFTERATASAPGFSLDGATPETREAVSEICRRLDGIPLALELAAARVRGLGVRELAARLEHRFRLLTSGQRGAPARQRTLWAMIDWSWELLSVPERIMLRRLAVHSDGCTLDAAEAVCSGDGVSREEVLDLVARLVDRSMVVVVDGSEGPRYRLLESVAAYALERLAEMADLTATRDRHMRYYLDLAEQAEPHLRDGEQQAWLARLDAEAANLRSALEAALRRAREGAGGREAVRLATALSWWWLLRGRLNEGCRTMSAVLTVTGESAELHLLRDAFILLNGTQPGTPPPADPAIDDPVRSGRAVWLYAYGLYNVGELAGSRATNARALDLFTAAGDSWGIAAALGLGAMHALVQGDLTGVERNSVRSAEIFRRLGDQWGELQATSPLSELAEIRGDYAEAEQRRYEGLRIAQELGLAADLAARYSGLGRLALLSRDWERAHELHERARRLSSEQGNVYVESLAVIGLALGARRSGDLDAAEAYLMRLFDHYPSSEVGDHLLWAERGFTAELRGDEAQATAHHLRGLELACSMGEPRALALSFEGLAGAAALSRDAGRAARAAELLGAADAARRGVGAPLPPAERGDVDRITAAATAVLGEDAFAESYRRGARLTRQEAVNLARLTVGRQ
ncbi:BTAD domain-containing putative transcriptional regulator [Nonomuraea jiangxiensis]|uniref:Predicted ATPase n=1 Tax=Nonomuraea jiangxiensis TaxID=633440 RepID=A0A1G9Q7Q8_9ACTN|nr:BTAD domain-containing putative transcriptional regulator [Nonomuraea jiangxiensis]SDM06507.1 Predicted ATPase [Nonomuraea jiangxiensis]